MIYFLDINCNDAGLSGILTAIKNLLNIIHIVAPLLLIIMASIHLFQLMRDPDDKKKLPKIKNAFIAAAIIFFVPTIVNVLMSILGTNTTVSACWNSARNKIGSDNYMEIEDGPRNEIYNDPSDYENGQKGTKEDVGGVGEVSQEASSSGTYYPALKGSNFRISKASATGGCPENDAVVHDLNISEGTPVYAGMDGVLEYTQYVCNSRLYSYGNLARITDSTTGTYILYAHLSKFVDAPTPITATCSTKLGGPGCNVQETCGKVSKNVQGKRNVKKGELIGYTGNVGNSDGPHLHVEIHENGSRKCVTDPYSAMGMR